MKKSTIIYIVAIALIILIHNQPKKQDSYLFSDIGQGFAGQMYPADIAIGGGAIAAGRKSDEGDDEMASGFDITGLLTSKLVIVLAAIIVLWVLGVNNIMNIITRNPILLVFGAVAALVIIFKK